MSYFLGDMKQKIKAKEESGKKLEQDLETRRREMDDLEIKFMKKERDMLEELEKLEQKNDILSNLVDVMRNQPTESEST